MQISSTNNQNPILNMMGTSSMSKEAQAKNAEKNAAYQLSISKEAQQAYIAAKQSQLDRFINPKIGGNLPEELKTSMQNMQDKLNRILLSNNIDSSYPIDLSIDQDGRIVVKGEHPDKEKIERVLNDDQQFVNEVKDTLNQASDEAAKQVNEKKEIRLKEHEEDDDDKKKQENEFERQLRITEKAQSVIKQITAASGDFSLRSGSLSFASLGIAGGAVI